MQRGESNESSSSVSSFSSAESVTADEREEFLLNFCSGEYDQKIQEALERTKAGITKLSGSRALYAYNGPNESHDQYGGRQELKRQLQDLVEEIQMEGSGGGRVALNGSLDVRSIRNIPIAHDKNMLDVSWEALSGAISQYWNVFFTHLSFHNCELTEDILGLLVRNLRGRVERSLRFENTDLFNGNKDRIMSLSELVNANPSLESIEIALFREPLTVDIGAICHLFKCIKELPGLRTINLWRCRIGTNLPVLQSAVCCCTERVILKDCDIGVQGVAAIADYLQTDPPLQILDLDENELDDDSAILLGKALRKNTHLQQIYILGNELSVEGVKAIFKAVFDPSSMNAISESNHECVLNLFYVYEPIQIDYLDVINNEGRAEERMYKMMTALGHSKESLLHYLSDVPLEFMPNVLALVQAQTSSSKGQDKNKQFGIVYTIMRWWEMPSLYTCQQLRPVASSKLGSKKRKQGECGNAE